MPWTTHPPVDIVDYNRLRRDTLVQRCFKQLYGPLSFWPSENVRFGAAPRRIMYTGDSDTAAVCETLVRDPRPFPGTHHISLPYSHFSLWGLVTLRLRRDIEEMSLCRPAISAVITDADHEADVRELVASRGDYRESERFARELLQQAPRLQALSWPSQRADGHTVHCFYQNGISEDDFEVMDAIGFNTDAGQARLEEAVRVAGLQIIFAEPMPRAADDDP